MAAHVLAFPWPLQGHINPMLHLASALLDAGLRVTFLHTEHNLRRFTRVPPHHPRLRLVSIPDGLPDHHPRSVGGLMELVESMGTAGSAAYRALLLRMVDSDDDDAVTCVIADGVMPFAVSVAEELGVPALAFRTESACGFLAYLSVPRLLELGETPVPSDEQVRACHHHPDDPVPVLLTIADTAARCGESRALILNTAASMEGPALSRIAPHMRDVFAVGPLHARPAARHAAEHVSSDDMSLSAWLDGHEDRSVVYVNLGSLTIVSGEQLAEFLHGLVAAGYAFLGVFRQDMLHQMTGASKSSVALREAVEAVAAAGSERALVVEWALQRDAHHVLRHRAVGCFLTHGGWNSTLEAAVEGVPAVCWPFFADQQTNSRFVGAVAVVERMVREAMESPQIRASAQSMGRQLRLDVAQEGSSSSELERLVGLITELSLSTVKISSPAPALTC
ncbi:hypothetical protein VPH35_094166 [Triticum aestivum]